MIRNEDAIKLKEIFSREIIEEFSLPINHNNLKELKTRIEYKVPDKFSQAPTETEEINYIKKNRVKKNRADDFLFLINRIIANFLNPKNNKNFIGKSIIEPSIENVTYITVADYLCNEIQKLIHTFDVVYDFEDFELIEKKNTEEFLKISPYFYNQYDWGKIIRLIGIEKQCKNEESYKKLISININKALSITEIFINVNCFKKIPHGFYNLNNYDYSWENKKPVLSFFHPSLKDEKDNYIMEQIINNEIIKEPFVEGHFRILEELKFEALVLNKSPQKLFKFLREILKPKDEKQEIQIKRFINNCFKWDSKYGSLTNYGNTITFLNENTAKILAGCLWFLSQENQGTIEKIDNRPFANILITELMNKNKQSIGFSDKLRNRLGLMYTEKGVRKKGYLKIFEERYPESLRKQFELFQ